VTEGNQPRHADCCAAISVTLPRSGLAQEPDVRPVCVAAWAGEKIFDETGQIESAAQALGVRSLDRAARPHWLGLDERGRLAMRRRHDGVFALERVEALLANRAV